MNQTDLFDCGDRDPHNLRGDDPTGKTPARPGTGPTAERCGSCSSCVVERIYSTGPKQRTKLRCGITNGRIKARWAACEEWFPKKPIDLRRLSYLPKIDLTAATDTETLRLGLLLAADLWDGVGDEAKARFCRSLAQTKRLTAVTNQLTSV